MGGGPNLQKLGHRFPIPYSLSFHVLAHSFAIFCTRKKIKSFLFMELHTLRQKAGGGVPPCPFGTALTSTTRNGAAATGKQSPITSHHSIPLLSSLLGTQAAASHSALSAERRPSS